ncbi:hypothetical protein [Cystobacter ferrugineus]|uniref:Oxidoreductase n=1 Tax=Cystobacter ferrugineus TaxID=83449 RepID=A0A1L9B7D2_9BACT|nr:hypothetical protein [Cystobacter ferrugineus]OJH38169.1 hypothetical protein BON30_23755 [Cystobacter ferrugineus]
MRPLARGLASLAQDCDIAEAIPEEEPRRQGVSPWARDSQAARRLWALSEQQLGREFRPG